MVQWGGFEEQRNEELEAYKGEPPSGFWCRAAIYQAILLLIPISLLLTHHLSGAPARHVDHWEQNGNPDLELWRFDTGFCHGWGAGNNEEHGELAEQRLAEHIEEVSKNYSYVWSIC
jgi:hypothetical protein